MKADSTKLFDFLSQNKVILDIPVFQRNYEWRIQQCQQLFKDLSDLVNNQNEHFLGTFVYVRESTSNLAALERIIDGQQRLTSCMLLLKAMADIEPAIDEEIEEQYLTNKYLADNQHLKLRSVERDRPAYRAIMNGKLDEFEGTSKIVENYEFFKECLQQSEFSVSELFAAMARINIVYIELNDDVRGENPQVIFESLNSTGVSLSPTDLVRNYLLMRLNVDLQESLYREYWVKIENLFNNNIFTEFLRHYLINKMHSLINRKDVYETYKSYFVNNNLTTQDALKELYQYARYYSDILNEATESPEFNHLLDSINIMDKKVIYPYLMKLLNSQQAGELTWDEVVEIATIWQSFLFRRMICNVPSNSLNRIVVSLLKNPQNESEVTMVTKRLLATDFPSDARCKEALASLKIYDKRRELAKLALILLEEHRSKENIDFEDAQVEHIMPQSLNNDWKIEVSNAESVNKRYGSTLGNLTLTKYNQEMSNKLFKQKSAYYQDSNINLTRELAKTFKSWGKDEITKRTAMLSDELMMLLVRPQETVTEDVHATGEHQINEAITVTGSKPIRLTIDGKDYPLDSWRELLMTFLNNVWDMDSAAFEYLKQDSSLGPSLFGTTGKSLRAPVQLSNGIEIDSNFSANSILAIAAKVAEIYGISDSVSYTIQ